MAIFPTPLTPDDYRALAALADEAASAVRTELSTEHLRVKRYYSRLAQVCREQTNPPHLERQRLQEQRDVFFD